jgi:hypothetical protein
MGSPHGERNNAKAIAKPEFVQICRPHGVLKDEEIASRDEGGSS